MKPTSDESKCDWRKPTFIEGTICKAGISIPRRAGQCQNDAEVWIFGPKATYIVGEFCKSCALGFLKKKRQKRERSWRIVTGMRYQEKGHTNIIRASPKFDDELTFE